MSDLPFEQQSHESPRAFKAFCVYRDLGPVRSLDSVAQELGKSRALIQRWSSKHAWVARVKAYDAALDARARKEAEKEAVKQKRLMFQRHGDQSRALQEVANTIIREFRRRMDDPILGMAAVDADNFVKMLLMLPKVVDTAQKLERLAVGEPIDNIEPPKPIEQMTDEELDSYIGQLRSSGA